MGPASVKPGAAPGGIPFGNFFSLGAGEVGSRGIAFVATALLARRVGAEGFGILGLAFALTAYLVSVPGAGLQDLAAREVARRPEDARRLAAGVIRFRLMLAFGLLGLAGILALLVPKPPLVRTVIFLSAVSVLPLAINTGWAYKGLERTRRVAGSLILAQLVYLAGVVFLVRGPDDLLRVPLVQAAGELAAALLLLPIVWGGWRSGSLRDGIATLRGGATITLTRFLRAVIVTADVVLLSFLTNDRETGLYSAAYRVCFLLVAIATSAHVVFLPALTRARADAPAASAVLGRSLWLSWTVALPLVVGGALVAPDLLALLFGPEFRAGGDAFRLLLVSIGILFLYGTLHNGFLARDRLIVETAIIGAAAIVNVALNLLVIPRYGLSGAALVMVITEAMILAGESGAVWRWGWRPPLRPLLRPMIAAALMAGLLLALPATLPVLARILLAGLAYAAALGLVGGLPRQARGVVETVQRS